MPHIQPHYPLTSLNTFGLQSVAELFVSIEQPQQLLDCIANPDLAALPWSILGGGSNLILPELVRGLVLKMDLKGRCLAAEDEDYWYVSAAAGENWHEFVQWTLAEGWGGLENLSLIPGTVGASPVQNIGAYGVEIKDVFQSLTAIHLQTGEQKIFNLEECQFAYRDSYFKREGHGVWCITSVTYRLAKLYDAKTNYGDVVLELEKHELQATPANIAKTICRIRQKKLPDPQEIGNAGSFFQNPIVNQELADEISRQYPALVKYKVGEDAYKLAAGWLIEQSGWKGRALAGVAMYERQALVMVNLGGATQQGVKDLAEVVCKDVFDKFKVNLHVEPIFWS